MRLKTQITEAIINEDRDFLSQVYMKLIKDNKIKPFKVNLKELLLLIKYNIYDRFKLVGCVEIGDDEISLKLVTGVYLFIDTILNYE